jgi:cysteine desulfurase
MMVNNEIGNIYPVEDIAKIAHEHNILHHVDAVQAVGKIPVDVKKIGCDFLTISAHKFYGLKGVGALFVKRGRVLKNLLTGGHQEKGKRPGTENVVGIVGMGKAIELAVAELDTEAKRIAALRDHLEKRVLEEIPYTRVVGDPSHRVPTLSNISFRFVEGEGILLKLDTEGISVSTGSACSSSDLKASHVITALNGDPEEAHSSIRFSLGKHSTLEDVDYTVETLKSTISLLRSFSPIYDEFVNSDKH